MKNIYFILLFLIASITCFSQSIVPRTNSSFTVMDSRFKAQYNLFVPAYADTTAANLQKGVDSLGAVIFTYNTMTLWVRSQSPKVWIEVGSGGGGGTWGSITGTLSNQTDLQNALNLKAPLISPLFTTPRLASTSTIGYVWMATDGSGNGSFQVLPSDNLLFDSLGAAGISPVTTWNNTLYARRISITGGSIDTTASGGLLITVSGGGGSGLFPTTGTGTATGAVVGSLDGNTLTVNQGANEFFHIDPTAGDEHAHLQAYNGTDLDNISTFTANTNNTSAIALFSASFNGSNKAADISALANATKSTLVLSADTNTVNGSVVLSNLAGNGVGIAGADNAGLTSFITVGTGLDLTAGVLTATGGGGTFVGLTDGPGSFAGQAGKSVRVNVGETALEYFTASGTGDVTKVGTPVNSQWGIWTGDGTLKGVAVTASRAVATDANGEPVASATTATELGYVNGVTSAIQTQLDNKVFTINIFTGSVSSFTDSQDIFFLNVAATVTTTATFYSMTIDRTCTLIAATIDSRSSTAGTAEDWTAYIRVNNTTDYLIETVAVSAQRRQWNNNALNTTGIPLVAGDEIVIKMINPAWVTNPATTNFFGYLTFR